jgi:maleate cis-trans isomerase
MSVRKRIGVMVPSTNTSFEADFQLVSPRDVTIHGLVAWPPSPPSRSLRSRP